MGVINLKALVCDRCEKVITDAREIQNTLRLDLCTNYLGKYDEKHLCTDCKSKFFDWLNKE